jgi:hypothetical protein
LSSNTDLPKKNNKRKSNNNNNNEGTIADDDDDDDDDGDFEYILMTLRGKTAMIFLPREK